MLPTRPTRTPHRRRGVVALETLLILPVFLILLTGMIGLADLLIAEQKMDEASGRAARVVALGGSDEQIEAAVRAILGPDRAKHATIRITPIRNPDEKRAADDEHKDGSEKGDAERGDDKGDKSEQKPSGGRHLGLIEVRVELEVQYAVFTRFVPLGRSEKLVARTVVQRQ